MRNIRTIAIAAAGMMIAATAGLFVFRGGEAPAPEELAATLPEAAPLPASEPAPAEVVAAALPALPALPQRLPPPEVPLAEPVAAAVPVCAAAELAVQAVAPASLDLRLSAPCAPGARVELRHGALAFAVLTDANGDYQGTLPALARNARVQALLPDGASLTAAAVAEGLDQVDRVVLLAGATTALHLNAFENGAEIGAAGHIRAAAPGVPGTGPGGYLTLLGDATATAPLLAEVYTSRAGQPEALIAVLAEVTGSTCGTDLSGVVMRMGAPALVPVTVAMPACDGIEGAVFVPLPAPPLALASADQR